MESELSAFSEPVRRTDDVGLNRSKDYAGRSGTMREIATRP
jgi:hypothetical protein